MSQTPVAVHRRPFSRRMWVVAAAVCLGGLAVGGLVLVVNSDGRAAPAAAPLELKDIPFDGARTYQYLKDLCAIGPRRSGSAGMQAQQKLLVEHFKKLGGEVELQRFRARHPEDPKSWVSMANIVVRWNPKSKERILLCAHYDTLPYPMRDPDNPRGTFVGANDNASGVAVLMELGSHMAKLKSKYGVDFVLLDAEEFIFSADGRFFLGSEFFAGEYAKRKDKKVHYRWGVLLDMIGAADLKIPHDYFSDRWRDTRPLVHEIWATAARLGVKEFAADRGPEVDDDHIMLHEVGHIACIDLIDFDYPPWHTQGDTPDKCSPLSLAKVGWVLLEWLKTVK